LPTGALQHPPLHIICIIRKEWSGISSEERNGKVREGRKSNQINLSSIIKEHRQLATKKTVIGSTFMYFSILLM
jgi:hypothetical protein